jgi:hypothetical protein
MVTYGPIEEAIRSKLVSHFSGTLNEDLCKISDIDGILAAMQEQDAEHACVLDYAGGRRREYPPFGDNIWVWDIVGFFFIKFRGDVVEHDRQAREVIRKLVSLLDEDPRLGGLVPVAMVTAIAPPEPTTINQIPVYSISFNVQAVDK